jgi:hypothetical protein
MQKKSVQLQATSARGWLGVGTRVAGLQLAAVSTLATTARVPAPQRALQVQCCSRVSN